MRVSIPRLWGTRSRPEPAQPTGLPRVACEIRKARATGLFLFLSFAGLSYGRWRNFNSIPGSELGEIAIEFKPSQQLLVTPACRLQTRIVRLDFYFGHLFEFDEHESAPGCRHTCVARQLVGGHLENGLDHLPRQTATPLHHFRCAPFHGSTLPFAERR